MSSRKDRVPRTPSFLSVIALDNHNRGLSQTLINQITKQLQQPSKKMVSLEHHLF